MDFIFVVATFASALKLMVIIELIGRFSPVNTNKGRFIGSLSKIKYGYSFFVKTWIKSYPIVFLVTSLILFLVVNAYLLYVAQRGTIYEKCYAADRESFDITFKNMIWLTAICFLTVGYGDFYPVNGLARAVNTFTAFGGLVYSAMIIGMVHEQINLTPEENHIFSFVRNRRKDKKRKIIASKLILLLFKMKHL